MNEQIWNEEEAQDMKEEKIRRVKNGEDESIFQLTLQKCHGGCDNFLTQEEYDLFEVHCWDCKGGNQTGGGWSD
tara:strand:- start:51 stop:272 length:222 start_codon:yes stop_codon:yes gene_type:complete